MFRQKSHIKRVFLIISIKRTYKHTFIRFGCQNTPFCAFVNQHLFKVQKMHHCRPIWAAPPLGSGPLGLWAFRQVWQSFVVWAFQRPLGLWPPWPLGPLACGYKKHSQVVGSKHAPIAQ